MCADKNLAGSIKDAFPGVACETGDTSEVVQDLLRGVRLHAPKLLKQLQEGDVERAQLGLGHAYSRARVKFSVQKNDNHIIQAIATLDHLDKAINTFLYAGPRMVFLALSPSLSRLCLTIIPMPNWLYSLARRKTLSDDKLHDLAAIVNDDSDIAQSIIDAARVSMGQDISDLGHGKHLFLCKTGSQPLAIPEIFIRLSRLQDEYCCPQLSST